MDKIFIGGLELSILIGVHPHERRHKQAIFLDLELGVDISLASASDSISKTIDYDYLIEKVEIFVAATEFLLIETLAEHIAQYILKEFSLRWLRLSLTKPGASKNAKKIGVSIERRSV